MNLIELSNNLKDVPDHYLMNEVQQPTGAYPAYLVISELTRRKGMRDRALKNDPKSTVVEDLTQPNREQMMAAVAQMQQPAPQQQPLPPQMPPQMPLPPQMPQMPPSGLMATPQASSLAATDAVASPRKRMAGGGLVAFQEGGDVKRFYQGGGMPYDLLQTANQSDSNQLDENLPALSRATQKAYGSLSGAAQGVFGSPKIKKIDPETGDAVSLGEYMKRQEAKEVAIGAKTIQAQKEAAQADLRGQITADHANVQNVILPKSKTALSRGSLGGSAASVPAAPQQQMPFPAVPTDEQLAAAGQKAIGMFGQNVPQRFSETEKEIGKRTQNLKDRRKSALNEALMMAGIGVLKSKSPGRYFGEGAEEGMLAYRQSMKDVRGGEDLMTDAKQSLAHQQLLQDLAQQKIGQDAQQRVLDMYRYGSDARYQQGQLANAQEQNRLAGLKLPAEINLLSSQAEMMRERGDLYGRGGAGAVQSQMLTPALRSQAVKNASMYMLGQGLTDPTSEQYKIAYPQALYQAQQALMTQNPAAQGAAAPGPNTYLNLIQ